MTELSLRQKIFELLDVNPELTNKELYEMYPKENENSLRSYKRDYFNKLQESISKVKVSEKNAPIGGSKYSLPKTEILDIELSDIDKEDMKELNDIELVRTLTRKKVIEGNANIKDRELLLHLNNDAKESIKEIIPDPDPIDNSKYTKIDDDMIEEIILERANSGVPLSDNFIKTCILFYKDIRGKDDKIQEDIPMEEFMFIGKSLKNDGDTPTIEELEEEIKDLPDYPDNDYKDNIDDNDLY